MAITGIVMMAYADNFHADSIIGVAFAVGSASTSALYKVFRVLSYVLIIICSLNFYKVIFYKFILDTHKIKKNDSLD